MSDIICRKCGEPWEAYGVHRHMDMDEEEARRFLRGEGCPCCKFGAACPHCNGSGKQRCEACFGMGDVPTHSHGMPCEQCPPMHDIVPWSRGIEQCPAPRRQTCRSCDGTGTTDVPCRICDGTGKPKHGNFEQFLSTLVESTDDDPIKLLNNVVAEEGEQHG